MLQIDKIQQINTCYYSRIAVKLLLKMIIAELQPTVYAAGIYCLSSDCMYEIKLNTVVTVVYVLVEDAW